MVTSIARITVSIDPIDVELLDRLAALEGLNRSAELRGILREVRPMLMATVEAFESALAQRDEFTKAAANAAVVGLESLMPELQRLQEAYLGAMSRVEGEAAAARAAAGDEPETPASNTGVTS
jgi:hypothetical protein